VGCLVGFDGCVNQSRASRRRYLEHGQAKRCARVLRRVVRRGPGRKPAGLRNDAVWPEARRRLVAVAMGRSTTNVAPRFLPSLNASSFPLCISVNALRSEFP
jgi:hypothetical protein